jgi:hypothetical protein
MRESKSSSSSGGSSRAKVIFWCILALCAYLTGLYIVMQFMNTNNHHPSSSTLLTNNHLVAYANNDGTYSTLSSLLLHGRRPDSYGDSVLCARTDWNSFVWSHRGHIDATNNINVSSSTSTDGSISTLKELLHAGIIRFDVDISHFGGEFYVAHPSKAAQLQSKVQWDQSFTTIAQFLDTIANEEPVARSITQLRQSRSQGQGRDLSMGPMISIEPKFDDLELWKKLIDVVQAAPKYPANRVALIVNAPNQLTFVENYLNSNYGQHRRSQLIAVSIAYRSVPKTDSDFSWQRDFIGATNLSSSRTKFRRMHMPDIKLLTPSSSLAEQVNNQQVRDKVVPWLVDDLQTMQFVLQLSKKQTNIDGIITNYPLKMTEQLREWRRTSCKDAV